MPRYDYKCRVCNYIFEAIVPANQETLPCIVCNTTLIVSQQAVLADRQLSAPAHIQIH